MMRKQQQGQRKHHDEKTKEKPVGHFTGMWTAVAGVILLGMVAMSVWKRAFRMPANWWLLLCVLSVPVACIGWVAAGHGQPHERLVALGAVGAILLNQFPRFVSVAMASAGLILFGLATRPAIVSTRSNRGKRKAALSAVLLATVLLTENFFVWVVAATYYPSHKGSPEPLQDNGRIMQKYLLQEVLALNKRNIQLLRWMLNVPWALVASAGMGIASVEMGLATPKTLWGITMRALLCLAAARATRTVGFLLTVLPSQMPDCYRHHFPPPPSDWASWMMVGMVPNSHGGCNDLIMSGHATVTSTLACLATSVSGNTLFSIALWCLLTIDFLMEVYEGFHYSVDMWMGALVTSLLWRVLSPLEHVDPETEPKQLLPLSSVRRRDILLYSIPALLVYTIVIIIPERVANYFIIAAVLLVGMQLCLEGFTHHVQHLLICVLFLALCIYL